MPYTVTIYVAAPGTPLKSGGTSAAGHVYYATSDGQSTNSFGFGPLEHGKSKGVGERKKDDLIEYQNPAYARTMEISAEQYNKLNQFGANPDRVDGFNMQYDGARNSCIDYTWAALNHAGLHSRFALFFELKGYEGSLKPMSNINDIDSIEAPVRGSPLNRRVTNPMPDRSLLQWIITEGESEAKLAVNAVPERYAPLHAQVDGLIKPEYKMRQIDWGNGGDNTVAACTVACVKQNITDVQHLTVANGSINMGQKNGFEWNVASIDAVQAARTPQRESFAQLAALDQQQSQQQDNPTQQQTQARKGPSIG